MTFSPVLTADPSTALTRAEMARILDTVGFRRRYQLRVGGEGCVSFGRRMLAEVRARQDAAQFWQRLP